MSVFTTLDEKAAEKEVKVYAELEIYKEAFLKAKAYIEECPCDPDIYDSQLEAWLAYKLALKNVEKL